MSGFARFFPNTRETADETKRRAWRDYGMLVVSVDHPELKWDVRETLRQLGDRMYGPRRPNKGDKR